jgi:hypothetical protein
MTAECNPKPCGSCRMAERNPHTGYYHSDCRECSARSLAHSPGFAASMAAGKFRADYADALREIAGDDASEREKLHQAVRAWDKRMRGEA